MTLSDRQNNQSNDNQHNRRGDAVPGAGSPALPTEFIDTADSPSAWYEWPAKKLAITEERSEVIFSFC